MRGRKAAAFSSFSATKCFSSYVFQDLPYSLPFVDILSGEFRVIIVEAAKMLEQLNLIESVFSTGGNGPGDQGHRGWVQAAGSS